MATDDNNTDSGNEQHPLLDRFTAAGYPATHLVDPGHITPGRVERGGWRVVTLKGHGVEAFDVDGDDVEMHGVGPSGTSVWYSGRTEQPIDFAEETGLLNDELPTVEQFDAAANPRITYFFRAANREFPEFDEQSATEALGYWGSEGWIPRGTADAMADAFGTSFDDSVFRDDPDVDGEEIARPPHVARRLVAAAGGSTKGSDSGIHGKKKIRRQEFYRNLEELQKTVGLEVDDE